MANVKPLRFWRAAPQVAARMAAVPYDVVDRAQARRQAAGNALSFLHVTKPEIDLADDVAATSDAVYAQGERALRRLALQGALVEERAPCYFAYALQMDEHRQVGVVLGASVADYEANIVRKHEHTRHVKETDRIRNIEALQAQSGKVFLLHRPHPGIASILATVSKKAALIDFEADDGVRHSLWPIADLQQVQALTAAFAEVGPLYIADGHHRAAAAARVAEGMRSQGHPNPQAERIMSVAFATNAVQIFPYHRVVRDLGAHTPATFLQALQQRFSLQVGKPPDRRQYVGLYIDRHWYTLKLRLPDTQDPASTLDVSLLQQDILGPLLGIQDPRRDERMDYVGGIQGDDALEARVHDGAALAFRMHATAMEDLLRIADAGAVMPPKSTWFEPKLRDGLVVLRFNG